MGQPRVSRTLQTEATVLPRKRLDSRSALGRRVGEEFSFHDPSVASNSPNSESGSPCCRTPLGEPGAVTTSRPAGPGHLYGEGSLAGSMNHQIDMELTTR